MNYQKGYIENTKTAHERAHKQMFAATNPRTNNKLAGTKGQTAGVRGTKYSVPPLQATGALPSHTPTGGKTPLGNDKGPMKKMNDNVSNKIKRGAQDNFNTGRNTGKFEREGNLKLGIDGPNLKSGGKISAQPFGDSSGLTTERLEVYKSEPKRGLMGTIASFFKGQDDSLSPTQSLGRGVDLHSMFQDCGKPGSPKKKMLITNEEEDKK